MRLVAVAALVLTVLGHVRVALQIGGGLDQVMLWQDSFRQN